MKAFTVVVCMLIGLMSAAPPKYEKKDWIGCEPAKLKMRTFDDRSCRILSKGKKDVDIRMIVDMTRNKCVPQSRWAFKGKCDMMTGDKTKL